MSMLDPLSVSTYFSTWHLNTGWLLICIGMLALYLNGIRVARQRTGHLPVGPVRVVSFVVGVAALAYATCSAIDAYAMALFSMHMVQHLMLIMVVPALLVAGHPLTVWRACLSEAGQGKLDRRLQHGVVAALTHPVVSFGIYAVVIFATHLTGFMDLMAEHAGVMFGEQLLYLAAGTLFFLTAIGREPIRWDLPAFMRFALLLIGMTPDTVVGIVLMQSSELTMPMYLHMRPDWAMGAHDDQYLGGSIMWFFGDGAMMALAIVQLIAFVVQPSKGQKMGGYLEGVRQSTLQGQVARSGGSLGEGDVDDDDAALEAYNQMLKRLNEHG